MHAVKLNLSGLFVIAVIILVFVGCGASGGSDVTNLYGTWQNPSNQQKVVINLAAEKKTIVINDKMLPVTIKPSDVDRFVVHVSDKNLGEKNWMIYRIWNDNGTSFTLKFEHDGQTENLDRVQG